MVVDIVLVILSKKFWSHVFRDRKQPLDLVQNGLNLSLTLVFSAAMKPKILLITIGTRCLFNTAMVVCFKVVLMLIIKALLSPSEAMIMWLNRLIILSLLLIFNQLMLLFSLVHLLVDLVLFIGTNT